VGRGDTGEWWRGWIELWYSVRTFVSVTVCPQYNNNIMKKEEKRVIHLQKKQQMIMLNTFCKWW
jgi:hypothetical protein